MPSTRKAALATFSAHLREAGSLINVAQIYVRDGAFVTAADRLEAAGVHLRHANAIKLAAWGEAVTDAWERAHG